MIKDMLIENFYRWSSQTLFKSSMRNRGRKGKKYEKKGKERVREKKKGKRMKKRMTGPIMLNTESTIGL